MSFPVPKQLLALPEQWQHPYTFFLVLLPVLYLFVARRWNGNSSIKGQLHVPPCPPGLPIIGNLHQMRALPHRSLWELSRRHGPVMMLRLGRVPTVVVSSPEAARDVLKTHDLNCCSRPDTAGPRLISYQHKDLAFTPYNEHWRQMRKLFVTEFRSPGLLQSTWDAREAEVGKLIAKLATAEGAPVFLEDHIFGCMDGIIGTVAFGNIYGTEQFTHKQHFHDVIDEAMIARSSFAAEDYFPNIFGRLVDHLTGVVSQRQRVFREFDGFFETILGHHLDPSRVVPENGGDLIDDLIDALMKQGDQGSMQNGRERIKALLSNTYIGAVDTGSVTIVWAMAELIRKPRLLKKVQEEIRAIVGNKERVQQDDLPAMEYLKMVVMETLRLHPALPLLVPRETMQPIKILGYDVPAKTRLIVNAWAVGRDPGSWDNPLEFDPDRFQEKNNVNFNGTHYELLPFGAGRRMCPGMPIGVATTEFILANLLFCFDWALPDGVTIDNIVMEEVGGLTLHKKTPLVLVPTRYNGSASY